MSRPYSTARSDLQRVRLIVAAEIDLRQEPQMRTAGLSVRTAEATRRVDAALRQEATP